VTDNRTQFTFYKSYWDAIEELPAKQQLPILKSIIRYALFGEEPDSLSSVCRAVFLLVKPTLDASRKKSESGKRGGKSDKANGKQTESKPEANDKQSASEKEKEKENENEIEVEKENNKRSKPEVQPSNGGNIPASQNASSGFDGQSFSLFWSSYPDGPGKISRESTYAAWKALAPSKETAAKILSSLEAWKKSSRWLDNGGAFVPSAANFLTKGYWKTTPAPAPASKKGCPADTSRKLDDDEREAIRRMLAAPEEEVPQ